MAWSVFRRNGDFPHGAAVAVLLLAALGLGAAAILTPPEPAETRTALLTSPQPHPDWPRGPATAQEMLRVLEPVAPPAAIAETLLREGEGQPPLYFWLVAALRAGGGTDLMEQRTLSVLLSLGALLGWMVAAWRAGLPVLPAGLLMAGAFGLLATGHLARGFALANLFLALSALGAAEARRRDLAWPALAGGLAGGLAMLAHPLAGFPALAILLWCGRFLPAAGLPFGLVAAAVLAWMRGWPGSWTMPAEPLALAQGLAEALLAATFGLVPPGLAHPGLGMAWHLGPPALAAGLVAWQWRRIGPARWLGLLGLLSCAAGWLVCALHGAAVPEEFLVLPFAVPFAALLLAGALGGLGARRPALSALALVALLGLQLAGALPVLLAQRAAPDLPALLALRDEGDDARLGAALRALPPGQRVVLLRPGEELPPLGMPDGAEGVVIGGADHRGEEAQRVRPPAVGERSAFHLLREKIGMVRQRLGGAAHGLAREDEL